MFLSESIARAIHADRVREIERIARDRRLLDVGSEPVIAAQPAMSSRCQPNAPTTSRRTGIAI